MSASAQLRERDRKKRAIRPALTADVVFEGLQQPVWIGLPDGTVEYVNPFWRSYTGFDIAGAPNDDWVDAVHPEDVAIMIGRFRAAVTTEEPYDVEYRFRRADGVYRWHLARVAPIRNEAGNVARWAGMALDIDDRKRGEIDAAWLAAIVEGSEEAIVGQTLDGIVTSWNPGAQRLLGYSTEEMVGREIAVLVPPDRRDELAHFRELLSKGQSIPSFETVRLRKDGTEVQVAITLSPVRDRMGEIVGVSNISRDVSHQTEERDLRRRERHSQLGSLIGSALTARFPLDAQLQRCADVLVDHLDAALARIWVPEDADPNTLVLRASAGLYTHLDGPHGRVRVGTQEIGRIAADRRPLLTNEVLGDLVINEQAWAEREGTMAFAGYPLMVGDRLLGVMAVFARQPLSESTLTVLGGVADTIALGIDRAKTESAREALLEREQVAREHAEATVATLSLLNRVGQLVAAELDLERLVQSVTDAATELVGAQFGAFFYNVVDERGETYTLYALSGAPREAFADFPMPRSTAIFGPTFRGDGILRLANVREDPRYGRNAPYGGLPPGHLPVTSYLAVPVISRSGEVLGGLFFGHPKPGMFDERTEELAAGLAAHAAVAIDNARLYRDAQAVEQRYRGLFEGVADTILVADDQRRYRDANAAATELLGYRRDELLTMRVEDVVVNERQWTTIEYERFLAEGRWYGELELRCKDGTFVPVEARATVVSLPDGQVYISAIRDVRERRAVQQLQQSFLESVSHDLKTPLTAIRAQAQMLSRRLRQGAVPDVERISQTALTIDAATQRMEALLDEFQDIARLRSGNPLELRITPTDLVALAEVAARDAAATTSLHRVLVTANKPSLVGRWDPLRLRRVLDNLLGNAIKYSPDGGDVTVAVGLTERDGDSWAVLTVCDQGVGIPKADLPHIFERYRRGSNVGERVAGAGIGLAGAFQIVQQHGGVIDVESEEGRGSLFTLALPLQNLIPPFRSSVRPDSGSLA